MTNTQSTKVPYTTRMSAQTRARMDAIARRLRWKKASVIQLAIDELWMKTLNKQSGEKYREQGK